MLVPRQLDITDILLVLVQMTRHSQVLYLHKYCEGASRRQDKRHHRTAVAKLVNIFQCLSGSLLQTAMALKFCK